MLDRSPRSTTYDIVNYMSETHSEKERKYNPRDSLATTTNASVKVGSPVKVTREKEINPRIKAVSEKWWRAEVVSALGKISIHSDSRGRNLTSQFK